MRILFLSHRLPYPPNKGDKIRSFHEILYLARRHQIHLLSLADPDETGSPEEGLREYCSDVEVFPLNRLGAQLRSLAAVAGSRPLTLSYFRSPELARRVEELVATSKVDVIMVCGSAMAQYAESASGAPKLLDLVDVDSAKWAQYSERSSWPKSAVWRLEARRLSRYESSLSKSFDRVVVTTSNEAETFASVSQGSTATVVRNGIDFLETGCGSFNKARSPTLVFTGQMDYFANVDGMVHFCREVLPLLRARIANLKFLIVGRSPTREVLRLSRLPGVTVTGEVEDVREYLAKSWVFVAPLRIARGVQNKVLEAMAMGTPVVVSWNVMAGLADGGFRDGEDLLVGADDRQIATALGRLLEDDGLRESLASSARSKLGVSYSWTANMETLEQQLEELVRSFPVAGSKSVAEPAAPQTL